jgi:hypothetical protein
MKKVAGIESPTGYRTCYASLGPTDSRTEVGTREEEK